MPLLCAPAQSPPLLVLSLQARPKQAHAMLPRLSGACPGLTVQPRPLSAAPRLPIRCPVMRSPSLHAVPCSASAAGAGRCSPLLVAPVICPPCHCCLSNAVHSITVLCQLLRASLCLASAATALRSGLFLVKARPSPPLLAPATLPLLPRLARACHDVADTEKGSRVAGPSKSWSREELVAAVN